LIRVIHTARHSRVATAIPGGDGASLASLPSLGKWYNSMMSFALTDEQRKQMHSEDQHPAEVIDPQTQRRYLLIPIEEYQALRDAQQQDALRRDAANTMGRRLTEGE